MFCLSVPEKGDQAFFMPPFAGDHATFVEGLKIVEEHLSDLGKPFLLKSASPWVVDRMKNSVPDVILIRKTGITGSIFIRRLILFSCRARNSV